MHRGMHVQPHPRTTQRVRDQKHPALNKIASSNPSQSELRAFYGSRKDGGHQEKHGPPNQHDQNPHKLTETEATPTGSSRGCARSSVYTCKLPV